MPKKSNNKGVSSDLTPTRKTLPHHLTPSHSLSSVTSDNKTLPPREKSLPPTSPPIVSLGRTATNVLKQLAKGGNPHSIAKILHCTKANVVDHLRRLRDRYGFASKIDDDVCSIWTMTNAGIDYLGGKSNLAMYERGGVSSSLLFKDRPHNIKIKAEVLEIPKDPIWLSNWKQNAKMKNNVFYHQEFGQIQVTFTGKSFIWQLPIIRGFTSSQLAMAEAQRWGVELVKKYEREAPGLKFGNSDVDLQVIYQEHALQDDPFAKFCLAHGFTYRDKEFEIDESETSHPETEWKGDKAHIRWDDYVRKVKDMGMNESYTLSEASQLLNQTISLQQHQAEINNQTASGVQTIANYLASQLPKPQKNSELNLTDTFRGYIR